MPQRPSPSSKRARSAPPPVLLGAHLSIAKGLHQALYDAKRYDATALQIFTKNASTWKERALTSAEIERFSCARQESGIHHIASHAAYLINLAGDRPEVRTKSQQALVQEMHRCHSLEIPYLVLHPGSHKGAGATVGIRRLVEGLDIVFSETPPDCPMLLLETASGQGTGLGHTFEELSTILEKIGRPKRVGVCLDTCHIFAAGYDIRTPDAFHTTMEQFSTHLGMDALRLLHLNDSKRALGTRVDRHEHIGKGCVGNEGFAHFMNYPPFRSIPKIIETPKSQVIDWDKRNLKLLRKLSHGPTRTHIENNKKPRHEGSKNG